MSTCSLSMQTSDTVDCYRYFPHYLVIQPHFVFLNFQTYCPIPMFNSGVWSVVSFSRGLGMKLVSFVRYTLNNATSLQVGAQLV